MSKTIELATKYSGIVDEKFSQESKVIDLIANQNYDWVNAKTVKVYGVSNVPMTDYDRTNTWDELQQSEFKSRYGTIHSLKTQVQEMELTQDKSATWELDELDIDETVGALEATKSLERQLREVVIPMVDTYSIGKIVENAGTTSEALALNDTNIYGAILDAGAVLDEALVPSEGRVLLITPTNFANLLKSNNFILNSTVGQDMLMKGVVATVDGMSVVKVPSSILGENVGFMIAHPMATVAPTKLTKYTIHQDPPFINGNLIEMRLVYDCFVLKNKAKAIYVHKEG